MKRVAIGILFMLVVLASIWPIAPSPARASEPRELLQATIDEVLQVVKDPKLKGDEHLATRREKLRQAVSRRFSYEEMARRSLATHWKRRSEQERREFVRLFAKLLEGDYARKLEAYSGERIIVGDQKVRGTYAQVKTAVKLKHDSVSIVYKLIKEADDWKVYDVLIEGMSLVNNFRAQFNRLILSSSYDELVKTLNLKVDDLTALRSPPNGKKSNGDAGSEMK